MRNLKVINIVERIVVAVATKDTVEADVLRGEILDATIIDNYYVVKALKTVCDTKNNNVYYEFANLMCDKQIFLRILDELYNWDDEECTDDGEEARKGMGNLQKYIDIIEGIIK